MLPTSAQTRTVDPRLLAVLASLVCGDQPVSEAGDRLVIRALGPLDVRRAGVRVHVPGTTPRAMLTMLALYPGLGVSSEMLTAVVWGEVAPRTATKALQTHVSALRRCLGAGIVLTERPCWVLAVAETDASRFDRAAAAGRAALRGGNASAALTLFTDALHLWRGQPVLPDTPRARSEATRWTEQFHSLVEDRIDALLACGQAAELIGTLELAVTESPLRERRWAQLMLALYRSGRQAEALAAYRRARALLLEQHGITPGPALCRLEAAILAHDPALDVDVTSSLPPTHVAPHVAA